MKNKINMIILIIMGIAFPLSGCSKLESDNHIFISAASSLQESLEEMVALYQIENPDINFHLNFGGSNMLKQQIVEGFNVDLFLSAHVDQYEELLELGYIEYGQAFALNEIVVITSSEYIESFYDIANNNLKVILANESVPIGNYTQDILNRVDQDKPGFRHSVMSNVISKEENVRQVLLKVSLGEGDVGFVYRTDALLADDSINVIELPEEYKVISESYIGLLKKDQIKVEAYNFYNFIIGDIGQEVLSQHGFK